MLGLSCKRVRGRSFVGTDGPIKEFAGPLAAGVGSRGDEIN